MTTPNGTTRLVADVPSPIPATDGSSADDLSVEEQSYIEDCSVCCQPMTVSYRAEDGELAELSVEAAG